MARKKKEKRAYKKQNAAYWRSKDTIEMAYRRNADLIKRTHPEIAAADAKSIFAQQVKQTMNNKNLSEKAAIKNVLRSRMYHDNKAEYEARFHHEQLMDSLSAAEKSRIYYYKKKTEKDISLAFEKMQYIDGRDRSKTKIKDDIEYYKYSSYKIGSSTMTIYYSQGYSKKLIEIDGVLL